MPRPRGVDHRRAKLSDASVAAIRVKYAAGVTQRVLAEEYGVSESAIRSSIHGTNWRHVTVAPEVDLRLALRRQLGCRGESGNNKLTEADVLAIRAHAADGVTHSALAGQYSVSRTAISYIVRRITWRHI